MLARLRGIGYVLWRLGHDGLRAHWLRTTRVGRLAPVVFVAYIALVCVTRTCVTLTCIDLIGTDLIAAVTPFRA